MAYSEFVVKFLKKEISPNDENIQESILGYLDKAFGKKERIILDDEEISGEKLREKIMEKIENEKKALILIPKVQEARSNRTLILGCYKKKENKLITDNLDNLKESVFKKLEKHSINGRCVVCGRTGRVIPIHKMISSATLTNPYNFEFGNSKSIDFGLCKEHVDRILWFYLLDIFNDLTPVARFGNYFVKFLIFLPISSDRLIKGNIEINKAKNFNEILKRLRNIEKDICSLESASLLAIVFKIENKKVSISRTYTVFNVLSWMNHLKQLNDEVGNLNKFYLILEFRERYRKSLPGYLLDRGMLNIFDLVFLGKTTFTDYKKILYHIYREAFFREDYNVKKLKDITLFMINKDLSIIERVGMLVGLVDSWYKKQKYKTRIAKTIFSKRTPSVSDVKFVLVDALRRIGLREDLYEDIKGKISTDNLLSELSNIENENINSMDILLSFSVGYFSSFKEE